MIGSNKCITQTIGGKFHFGNELLIEFVWMKNFAILFEINRDFDKVKVAEKYPGGFQWLLQPHLSFNICATVRRCR